MKENYPENWAQFYTATLQGWKHLFKEDKYKAVIGSTVQYLVENKKVKVNAFLVKENHILLKLIITDQNRS